MNQLDSRIIGASNQNENITSPSKYKIDMMGNAQYLV